MEYKHFSHPHNLTIYQVQQGQQFRCSGCESFCSGTIYGCFPCNFYLHDHCGNATRYVKHPAHSLHPLILVPYPTYSSGSFFCNACGQSGSAFSYCCALCEVDLHIHCAFLPPKVSHNAHQHELNLCFFLPDRMGSPHVCKICSQVLETKHWSYACAKCDFRTHTYCATTEVTPGLYQIEEAPESSATETEVVSGMGGSQQNAPVYEADDEGRSETIVLTEDAVVELYKLQLQMQMAEEMAQMMSSFNLGKLV